MEIGASESLLDDLRVNRRLKKEGAASSSSYSASGCATGLCAAERAADGLEAESSADRERPRRLDFKPRWGCGVFSVRDQMISSSSGRVSVAVMVRGGRARALATGS